MKREVSKATRRWSADQLRSRPHLGCQAFGRVCALLSRLTLIAAALSLLVRWCPAPENPGTGAIFDSLDP